jgi:exopolyphosphatase/guanosine-5'-triphosphate,3'-diphosphate pyrophosphatase
MPGFPTGEQQVLACIVAGHRGKFSRNSFYDEIPGSWSRRSKRLTVLLRLAVLLNRSRNADHATEVVLHAKGGKITVSVPLTLLETGPLTWADLEREVKLLADAGLELTLERLDEPGGT